MWTASNTPPLIRPARRGGCGTIWQLDTGDAGIPDAAWCPERAARARHRGKAAPAWFASERGAADALERARRLPPWLWLAPREDAFVRRAHPDRRRVVTAIARHALRPGVDVALTTRGGLRQAGDLVQLAREFPARLAVRVGVFSRHPAVVDQWEAGLAPTSQRVALAAALQAAGADVTVELGPIIPFVNDDPRMLRMLARQLARAGLRAVTPRWIEDAPHLLEQVQREVSRSASRLLGGWLGQPGASGPGGRRVIALHARRPRRQRLHEAVRGFGLAVSECRCAHDGASVCCPVAPRGAASPQLELFKAGA